MLHKASGRYASGHKRCQICDLFVQWEGIFCPCCGCRLRIGPRLYKHKAKLRIKQQKEMQLQKAQNENSSNIILHMQQILELTKSNDLEEAAAG